MIQILAKTERSKYFGDSFGLLPSTGSIGKFNFTKFHVCKMTENESKTSDQIVRTFHTQNNTHRHFSSLESYKTQIFI